MVIDLTEDSSDEGWSPVPQRKHPRIYLGGRPTSAREVVAGEKKKVPKTVPSPVEVRRLEQSSAVHFKNVRLVARGKFGLYYF